MTKSSTDIPTDSLTRGVLTNALGLLTKFINPLFIIVVTRCFGPAIAGVFMLASSIGDIARAAAIGGYGDAITILGSKALGEQAEGDPRSDVYRVIMTGFKGGLFFSLILLLVGLLGAGPFARQFFPEQADLASALRFVACSLPLMALMTIALAATKAQMRMEYDVLIQQLGRPLALLGAALVAFAFKSGLKGLMLGFFAAHVVLGAVSIYALSRCFPLRLIVRGLREESVSAVHRFAWPQNATLTLSRYQARADILALGALGYSSAQIAFYGTAALLATSLREIRLMYSSALAPIAARHHGAGRLAAMEDLLGRVSRWTTTWIIPVVGVVAILRGDLLRLIGPTYTGDSTFAVVLLWAPLLSCAFGIAGNCLLYSGHSGWTLANGAFVACVTTALNWLLIPRYGLMGAAAAFSIAATVQTLGEMTLLRLIEGVKLRINAVYKAHVGLIPVLALLAWTWDPADRTLGYRLSLAIFVIFVYLVSSWVVGHEEICGFLRRSSSGVLPGVCGGGCSPVPHEAECRSEKQ